MEIDLGVNRLWTSGISHRSGRPLTLGELMAGLSLLAIIPSGVATFAVAQPGAVSPAATPLAAQEFADHLPQPLEPEAGFAGSQACLNCHADEHASWHHSYHRSMTQPATPEAVVAPFDGRKLEFGGRSFRLSRKGDAFWVEMVDPDWEREQILEQRRSGANYRRPQPPPRVTKRVVMTTGSHHKQTFWVPSSKSRFLLRLPWTYRIDDRRWIPAEFDYLSPPDQLNTHSLALSFWDTSCIHCHSVAGQPRGRPGSPPASHVAELGISCESCHGPAAEHVRIATAAAAAGQGAAESPELLTSIVLPSKLAHRRASQVCGQCHSFFTAKDQLAFADRGSLFRAGDDLHETRHVVQYEPDSTADWLRELRRRQPDILRYNFWRDGTIRVTGRDYNGLLETGCFQRGELSCLSCHSMHSYEDRSDQLAVGMQGNQACLQCHDQFTADVSAHTHHAAESSGSLCYNCHMPHTTYGLFKAVRAHRIDSPSVNQTVTHGRPNACNLCHLDQSLSWTNRWLSEWYDQPSVELDADQAEIATSVLWLMRGDPAQRAIAAWHMGWQTAVEVSGEDWLAPFLAFALLDRYPAVRNVAQRSLHKLERFAEIEYDFLASQAERRDVSRQVIASWIRQPPVSPKRRERLLIGPRNQLRNDVLNRLLQSRDNRPLYIAE